MAGREVSGVENAKPDLFKNANYIVTPTPTNTEAGIQLCEALGKAIGAGSISRLTPKEHDEMIGFLSQLTHCIAVALMTCKESRHLVGLYGRFVPRFNAHCKDQREYVDGAVSMEPRRSSLEQMDLFLNHFASLRDALKNGDEETMKNMMRLSTGSADAISTSPDWKGNNDYEYGIQTQTALRRRK